MDELNKDVVSEQSSAQDDSQIERVAAQDIDAVTQTGDTPKPEESKQETAEKKIPDALKPKGDKSRFQGRITDLVNLRKAAEEENRRLRAELESLRGGSRQDNPAPKRTTNTGEPNADDYDTYQAYVDALVEYKLESKAKAQQAHYQQQRYAEYQQQKRQEFEAHATPIAQQIPEFWDAIQDPSLPVTEDMYEAVLESGKVGPYVMLYLVNNRAEAERLARLSPRAATIEIGRIADRIERDIEGNGAQPQTPGVQPKPVPQIRGSAPGSLDQSPSDKDDINTWLAKEVARQRLRSGNKNLQVYGARA